MTMNYKKLSSLVNIYCEANNKIRDEFSHEIINAAKEFSRNGMLGTGPHPQDSHVINEFRISKDGSFYFPWKTNMGNSGGFKLTVEQVAYVDDFVNEYKEKKAKEAEHRERQKKESEIIKRKKDIERLKAEIAKLESLQESDTCVT